MALEINGTVKEGKNPIDGEVKLQILDNLNNNVVWASQVSVINGSFFWNLQDVTNSYHNYKGMTLEGHVLDGEAVDQRFEIQKVVIPGEKVELHFLIEDDPWPTDVARRMLGAARLNQQVYAHIDDDEAALPQSMTVLSVACLLLGAVLGWSGGAFGVIASTIASLVVFGAFAALICLVGMTLLKVDTTNTNLPRFLRTFGFATTPIVCGAVFLGLLLLIGASPDFLNFLLLIVVIWELAALTVSTHQALDYRSQWWRALFLVLGAFAILAIILFLLVSAL